MDGPIYEGPPQGIPSSPYRGFGVGRRTSGWSGTLILACLALGFLASAVEYERVRVKSEEDRAGILAIADSSVEGQLEDLGKFLAEPQTRLIRLTPPGVSLTSNAVIAWNSGEQRGYLLCDSLGVLHAGEEYEVWAMHDPDEPVQLAGIEAKPGMSVYLFRATSGIKSKDRLEITAGPRSEKNKPILTGEIE